MAREPKLWAVQGDPNTHGEGKLKAEMDSSPKTVFIENKPVIVHESPATPDLAGHIVPDVDTKEGVSGSYKVFAYGKPAHRDKHLRKCLSETKVENQSTVFISDT